MFCCLLDGKIAAQGRRLIPTGNTVIGWFGYLLDNFIRGLPIWAAVLAFVLKSSEETEWNIVQPLAMIIYYVLWKFTLAAKHSLSNTLDHKGFYGMNSTRYIDARRLERMQLVCWIMDNGSNQPGAVLEELYTASLRADCDLSKLQFDVGSETIARSISGHVKKWKLKAATSLIFHGKTKDIPLWHPQHPEHLNAKLLNSFIEQENAVLSKLGNSSERNTKLFGGEKNVEKNEKKIDVKTQDDSPENSSPYTVHDIQCDSKSGSELDTQCSSTALPILSISKYAESDDFCLFREFFKETNDTDCDYVESLVAEGKVPATYIAFLIALENWRADAKLIGIVNLSAFFTCFAMAFLPAICRAIYRDDHIAFGKSQNARYVFGFGFVGSLFPIFMLFTYITNCSMEMNFRFKASKFMRNLLLPEGGM